MKDILGLVKDISASWNELGAELVIPMNDRTTFQNRNPTDNGRLEIVLRHWIQNETKEVKWEVILEALRVLQRKDLIKKVIEYMEKPEILYRKYILMKDFYCFPFN